MKWISVEDQLPENDTPVLVYIADRGTAMLTHFYDDFALVRADFGDGFSEHGVTHWTELKVPVAAKDKS